MTVLEAHDVYKTYIGGDGNILSVLNGVNLSGLRGEGIAIVGASGGGKGTRMHVLGARDKPRRGSVVVVVGRGWGDKVVVRARRDAGFYDNYTGLRHTPEMVVDAALQEDAQVIGLSIHSGAHMTLFPAVVQELKRRKATDIVVFGGGIIPEDDIAALKKKGVAELFTPGTPLQDIVDWLRKRFPPGGS